MLTISKNSWWGLEREKKIPALQVGEAGIGLTKALL
jgi:hypothetical protein